METASLALFETAIGRCGLAWRAGSILGVTLPARTEAGTVARLRQLAPGAQPAAMPAEVAALSRRLAALLKGVPDDLADVALDFGGQPELHRRVYGQARAIPFGQSSTYGALARALGEPGAARAVGMALGSNPWPLIVPCHRVLAADGRLGGFSAPGGSATKRRLLEIEGTFAAERLPLFGGLG